MSNVWLKLSGSVYMFGIGGITAFKEGDGYNQQTQRALEFTQLFNSDGKPIGSVQETVEEIEAMLAGRGVPVIGERAIAAREVMCGAI